MKVIIDVCKVGVNETENLLQCQLIDWLIFIQYI